MSISRLPQLEQTSRARHSRTGVSAPYQRACSAGSGSLRWPHALHQMINRMRAAAALPKVIGDSNQLLQVCLQLIATCLHVLSERGGKALILKSERDAENCVLKISTPPVSSSPGEGDSSGNPENTLGLSACQGILHEHRGMIIFERHADGSMLLRVELPVATDFVGAQSKTTKTPVLWQSQPYA